MTGTKRSRWSYEEYLEAKTTVDDRALNRGVLQALGAELAKRAAGSPLRVVEIGGGTGTMVRRVVEMGLLSNADYSLVDADPLLLQKGMRSLDAWGKTAGLRTDAREAGALHIHRGDGSLQLRVRAHATDVFEYLRGAGPASFDLLIASAFLDLVELPSVLPELLALLAPAGLFWFPINFDGETIFEPSHASDAPLLAAYHRTMDERVRDGRPAGHSRTGRRLFEALSSAGAVVHAAGSSDWVVYPQGGEYPARERYFLSCILSTIEEALAGRVGVDASELATWLGARRTELEQGKLVYIAHQLDFLGSMAQG